MSAPKPDKETCPYCGEPMEAGERILHCPRCARDGCSTCIPGGRNCLCPECEDGDGE